MPQWKLVEAHLPSGCSASTITSPVLGQCASFHKPVGVHHEQLVPAHQLCCGTPREQGLAHPIASVGKVDLAVAPTNRASKHEMSGTHGLPYTRNKPPTARARGSRISVNTHACACACTYTCTCTHRRCFPTCLAGVATLLTWAFGGADNYRINVNAVIVIDMAYQRRPERFQGKPPAHEVDCQWGVALLFMHATHGQWAVPTQLLSRFSPSCDVRLESILRVCMPTWEAQLVLTFALHGSPRGGRAVLEQVAVLASEPARRLGVRGVLGAAPAATT